MLCQTIHPDPGALMTALCVCAQLVVGGAECDILICKWDASGPCFLELVGPSCKPGRRTRQACLFMLGRRTGCRINLLKARLMNSWRTNQSRQPQTKGPLALTAAPSQLLRTVHLPPCITAYATQHVCCIPPPGAHSSLAPRAATTIPTPKQQAGALPSTGNYN